ncbi:MAG: glycogen debranching protein GlgX [Deltaproteobacteria bacterium]|nr:glycogen debranching protein GlgX [Deltaproteobacteria bacterium]
MKRSRYRTRPGSRYPYGAKADPDGVNFSIFSRHATRVTLLLYERSDSASPFQEIELDPRDNRTFFFWHVYVEGLGAGCHYAWRAEGPADTGRSGHRFDARKVLLDPWARAVTDGLWDRELAKGEADNGPSCMRGLVLENNAYDWEGDGHLNRPMEETVIYELHVGGFTKHPSSGADHPGTFRGLMEKIPYLKGLGITDVELLPVMAFDRQDVPREPAGLALKNYWGYSPHSFFSPHPGYCTSPETGSHVSDFRDMVKALHRAGIGVILDVVFNHTAEAGADGPLINFKGFANEIFYHLDPEDRGEYVDYTGCGNTVNCNHPLVSAFLVGCLEYWVREMHVDGFRFDLASVLARGEDGRPMANAPILWNIEFSDLLARTKIIAEAWDAAGLYQVGAFPGYRWAEWNAQYRDAIRRFVRGEKGLIGEVATRIGGSSDLYEDQGRLPINSVNFVTCHDGFTLRDLVSYDRKHNEANGQENRDGTNDNYSWNCGWEGETDDPDIMSLRHGQARNFMAILLLSQGVPMLRAGDEVLQTRKGNNNGYCQDNELNWFDWTLVESNGPMLRFVREMIAFRRRHPCLMRRRFFPRGRGEAVRVPDVAWHGLKLDKPLWHDRDALVLACTLGAVADAEEDLHVVFNMSEGDLDMPLPEIPGRTWHLAVDTAKESPGDIVVPHDQRPVQRPVYSVSRRSVVVLESRG